MQILLEHRAVVVGVDGSPNSLAALRRAAREAVERRARLDVIRVVNPGADAMPRPLRTAKEWLRLRDLVAHAVPRTQHLTTRLKIAHGRPGEVLAKAAEHAELLVIGARVNSEHGNPFGGDTVPVARELARCPVVICADQTAASQETS
ncbi:universal stress protein [Actinomadura sp. NTSP31]|uniref:universal stress protein n=1 Tax=Actinomadura sp. NTSP31 TaxID=1735447 RepID=UPI0035C1756A